MLYLKTKLTEIENIPMFSPRALTHGLEKRQAGEEEEGRGWKSKDKKKKKKDKKRKKKKEKVFIEELEVHSDAAEGDEVVADATAAVADPYTSGLQFSAYSSQPQPAYQPLPPPRAQQEYLPEPQPAREYLPGPQRAPEEYLASPQPALEDRAQYLYGLDSQGNAQYMDEAAIEEVLQTPQALKVRTHIPVTVTTPTLQAMMTYLVGSRSSGTPPSIPSRLQEHFQPRAQGHRQPPRQQVCHLLPGVTADPVSPGAQTAATGLQAAPSSPAHAVLRAGRLCAGAASQCAGISLHTMEWPGIPMYIREHLGIPTSLYSCLSGRSGETPARLGESEE